MPRACRLRASDRPQIPPPTIAMLMLLLCHPAAPAGEPGAVAMYPCIEDRSQGSRRKGPDTRLSGRPAFAPVRMTVGDCVLPRLDPRGAQAKASAAKSTVDACLRQRVGRR